MPVNDEPSDSEWLAPIDQLKQWVQTRRDSVTAPIALGNAYLNYAYLARGGGYANTVTDEGWRLFAERVQLARETLERHSALRKLCDGGKDDETDGYSWNRIKEGYNAIQQNMGLRSIT